MKKRLIIGLAAMLVSGCATVMTSEPEPLLVNATFDPQEVAWVQQPGNNTIRGNAVLRTVGGEVRTCAGLPAYLVPASTYAEERFRLMYGNKVEGGSAGYLPANSGLQIEGTDPDYERNSRTTRCNSEGNFTFSNLPDGEYFVTAVVTWGVPQQYFTSAEGGVLMQRIRLQGGETEEIVLTSF